MSVDTKSIKEGGDLSEGIYSYTLPISIAATIALYKCRKYPGG